jgi:hypothetical protein
MNRFTEKSEIRVSNGLSIVHMGDKGTPREQAKQKAYVDDKNNLYIPGPNIYAAIIAAGKFHKYGKTKVTTNKTSLIPAGIFILDAVIPLNTTNFEVDSRSVVIPPTGGRIMCHRPRLDNWKCTFDLEVDEQMFNEKFVRLLIDDAGKKIGVGDFRPEKKGPFGRFQVIKWRIVK